jgi:hypothetical protein
MRWKIALPALAIFLVITAGAVFLLREELANYWIRNQLAGQLAKALGAEVDLQGVAWKDGVLQARRLRLAGGNFPFTRLEARGLRAVVDWQRILEPSAEPLHLEITEADVVLRGAGGRQESGGLASGAPGIKAPPLDLLVGRLSLRHADDAGWSIEGTSLRALQQGEAWTFAGNGGTFTFPGWPEMEIERISSEHNGGRWHVRSFAFKDKQGGVLGGSAAHADGVWSGEFTWQDVDLKAFVPENVATNIGGVSSGDAVLKDGAVSGKMKLTGASSKAVGLLVKFASMLDREDWSEVPWQIFRFDFQRQADGRIDFADFQALSPKGIAVRGDGHYAPDSLGADLQVGIRREGRPYLGAFMPVLFSHERDGYFWTPLKISGTPSQPKENLTGRIVSAMAVVPVAGAAEAAVEVPAAATEAVGDLLRGLLRH